MLSIKCWAAAAVQRYVACRIKHHPTLDWSLLHMLVMMHTILYNKLNKCAAGVQDFREKPIIYTTRYSSLNLKCTPYDSKQQQQKEWPKQQIENISLLIRP